MSGRLGFVFHPAVRKIFQKAKVPQYSGDTGGEYILSPLTDAGIARYLGYPFQTTARSSRNPGRAVTSAKFILGIGASFLSVNGPAWRSWHPRKPGPPLPRTRPGCALSARLILRSGTRRAHPGLLQGSIATIWGDHESRLARSLSALSGPLKPNHGRQGAKGNNFQGPGVAFPRTYQGGVKNPRLWRPVEKVRRPPRLKLPCPKRAPPLFPGVTTMNIVQADHDKNLFQPLYREPKTWRAWETFKKALFALPMTKADLAL